VATYELTYPSEISSEERMLSTIQGLLEHHEVEAPVLRRFMLAISEAFNNALVHGNDCDPSKHINIVLIINDDDLHADITDQGHGGLEQIDQRLPAKPLDEGGRGVDLIRHCASEATFTRTDGGALKVSIRVLREKNGELSN
jgi:serine/threonine-protein kinase RsbW